VNVCILLRHKRKKSTEALAKKLSLHFCGELIAFVDRRRTQAYESIMSRRSCTALFFLIVANLACAASWDDDSHYISLGPRNGYYIVQPDSRLFYQLGLYEAPVIDTADPLRHGYGADALAFRFNRNGVLIAPPAYIAQALPYDFYMRRIGTLTVGRATVDDVETLFGRGHNRADRPDGFMWYYALPVYNPFEDRGGRR
jgi:hypothetical protein